jgi:DeoR family transcriptional regulator, fructose operon transcriptional repressor
MAKPLAAERRRLILAHVAEHIWVTTRELCDLTQVSMGTVRRDLRSLAASGQLTQVHGGATSVRVEWRGDGRPV